MITIDKITIVSETDTSWPSDELGEYRNTPGDDDKTIDRQSLGHQGRNEYRYFVAAMSGDPDSVMEDYRRAESLNRGEWYRVGITAVVTVSYPAGTRQCAIRRMEMMSSAGLWGIDSDSGDSYIQDVIKEELADICDHLRTFGVCLDNFDAMAEHARKDFRI